MSRPCPSRLSTHSVMSNSGFGDLTIHTSDGTMISIPKEHIKKDGSIKQHIFKRTQVFTRENCEYLESKGIKILIGNRGE